MRWMVSFEICLVIKNVVSYNYWNDRKEKVDKDVEDGW